jgi:hypothetical protein
MNKKQLQQQVNRYYSTNLPCKIISEIIGIGKVQFMDFIDSHFWDESINRMNYGTEWQLDHVVPQNLFDIEKEEDILLCFNYMNYIPMLNQDNRLKGGSIHFSVHILNKRLAQFPDNPTLHKLMSVCQTELDSRWAKYS